MLLKIINKLVSPVKVFNALVSPFAGKKRFQYIFEDLHKITLRGMNIGCGATPKESGEQAAIEYVNNHFKTLNELVIFDGGANIGNYTLLLKEIFGEKATIYAFEPSHKTFEQLSLNIGNTPKINLCKLGLGDKNAKAILYSNPDESSYASVYNRNLDYVNVKMNEREEIEIKTIDTFCQENKIEHIHFLKLDVEGHEKNVFEGASTLINSGAIDFIQFEFGSCNIDSKTYFKDFYYLLNNKYKIFRIVKDGLHPITRYQDMNEAFYTTNYLAEKKEL